MDINASFRIAVRENEIFLATLLMHWNLQFHRYSFCSGDGQQCNGSADQLRGGTSDLATHHYSARRQAHPIL